MGGTLDLSDLTAGKKMAKAGRKDSQSSLSSMSYETRSMESGFSDGTGSLLSGDGSSADALDAQEASKQDYASIYNAIQTLQHSGEKADAAKTTYRATFEVAVNSFGGKLKGRLSVSKETDGKRVMSFSGEVAGQSIVVNHVKKKSGVTVDVETKMSAADLKSNIEEWTGQSAPQVGDSEDVSDFEGFITGLAEGDALDESLESEARGRLQESIDKGKIEALEKAMGKAGLKQGDTGRTYEEVEGKYVKVCTYDLKDQSGTKAAKTGIEARGAAVTAKLGNAEKQFDRAQVVTGVMGGNAAAASDTVASSVTSASGAATVAVSNALVGLTGTYSNKTNVRTKSNIKYTGNAGLDQAIKDLKTQGRDSFVNDQPLFFETLTQRANSTDANEIIRFENELRPLGLVLENLKGKNHKEMAIVLLNGGGISIPK